MLQSFDIYSKSHSGERTALGGVLSVLTLVAVGVILIVQVVSKFISTHLVSEMLVSSELLPSKVNVNLDLTFSELTCARLAFDATDALGTRILGSSSLRKYHLVNGELSDEGVPFDSTQRRSAPAGASGCRVAGSVEVHRVPGNLRLSVLGGHANTSHTINHLSFGSEEDVSLVRDFDLIDLASMFPLDQKVTASPPGSYDPTVVEYYLKVVSTRYRSLNSDVRPLQFNQYTANHNLLHNAYSSSVYFRFDFSPVTVDYREARGESVYDFVIELMAIIGGVFTAASLVDTAIYRSLKAMGKDRIGKLG